MSYDNKALTRRWFEEVWNNRKRQVIHEMCDAGIVAHGLADGAKAVGVDGFIPFFERFVDSFPDMRIEVDDVIAEGDKTAARIHATGTHTGGALGIAPTGNPIRMTALVLIRWKDGRIVEAWNEFDAWGMMQQIGVPRPATVKE